MADQAESLRRMVLQATSRESSSRRGALVLVFSSQGGVESGALGLQLALAWKRRGEAAAVVQLSRQRPPWLTHEQLVPRATLQEVSCRERILREAWLTGPCGLAMVGDDLEDDLLTPSHPLVEQLRLAAQRQRVVIDTQELADLNVLLPIADHCLFVGRMDSDSMTATYRAIKVAVDDVHRARCWLAICQVTDRAMADQMQARVVMTCDRCLNLALDPLEGIPADQDLAAEGVRDLASLSLHASTPYQRSIDRIVERLDVAIQRQLPSTPVGSSA